MGILLVDIINSRFCVGWGIVHVDIIHSRLCVGFIHSFIHFPFLKLVNTIIKIIIKSTKTKHLAMPAYIFMLV